MLVVLLVSITLYSELIPVRHVEGVTLGFLVLRDLQGKTIASGEMKQVIEDRSKDLVLSDLRLRFKDGSFYQELTRFTQRDVFRLVSDQVVQKGPSFKQDSESWIDVAAGNITVRVSEKGKPKIVHKHMDLPPDVANGLLNTLLKNVDPTRETTLSMVAVSTSPRLVELNVSPEPGKSFSVGSLEIKAQHYRVKIKIEGVAGIVAPLVGKQPPDLNVWIAKSQAPTFLEFEGVLSPDAPVWRMELAAPDAASAQRSEEQGANH